jgi:DNA repair protein RecN (Recombination protein N)
MLLSLRIQNFALIDQLELEFGLGLNVLTGETGAGKSIILDAIDILLGGKATARSVRSGTDKATIEGTFRVGDRAREWLTSQDIDLYEDGTIVCSRELSLQGENLRSRLRVNGVIFNRKLTEELRELTLEITAQGQTIQLTTPSHQRELLDIYGGEDIISHRHTVSRAFQAYQEVYQAWQDRQQSEQERRQRIDFLQYQVREIEDVHLTVADELTELEEERQRLTHVVDLQQQSYTVYQELYQNDDGDSPAVADLLGQAESTLSGMVDIDSNLQPILDLVSTALAQVTEAAREINHYGDSLEADPDRLEEIEARIRSLKQICRKYGPTLMDAIGHYLVVKSELEELLQAEESLSELEQRSHQLQSQLNNVCEQLTTRRQLAAMALEQHLIRELKPLAMEKVQFQVNISPQSPTPTGADSITFYFSPNPGEPLQPLAETASGGEMSRFLLALKACFSQVESVGVQIFDEIDAGVSGKVAQAIADKLYHLSHHQQILCVTHQPLVAAMADRHFRVTKTVIPSAIDHDVANLERTIVSIQELREEHQRCDEIAQIAGGKSAQESIAFATSLLSQAQTNKQKTEPSQPPTPRSIPKTPKVPGAKKGRKT